MIPRPINPMVWVTVVPAVSARAQLTQRFGAVKDFLKSPVLSSGCHCLVSTGVRHALLLPGVAPGSPKLGECLHELGPVVGADPVTRHSLGTGDEPTERRVRLGRVGEELELDPKSTHLKPTH